MKSSKKKLLLPVIVIAVIAAIFGIVLFVLSQDDTLNMADVYSTIGTIAPYFIPAVILAVVLYAVSFVTAQKWSKKANRLYNWEAVLALVLAIVVTVNVVCFGPMSTVISLAMPDVTGNSEEVLNASAELAEEITNQGTVLLKNEADVLPIGNTKLNVFGWASTNPCYGGTGSGNIDPALCATLISGLEDAGFELNKDLENFYVSYRADRPEVSMWTQDWTLPEPTVDSYTDELMNAAKDFSDTALIVISRVGGEGADLPTDMSKVTYEGNPGDFDAGEHYLQLSKSEEDMVALVAENFANVVVVYNGAAAMELDWVNDYASIKGVVWSASPAQEGFNSLGNILAGKINPSGRTVDTFVSDLTQTPTWNNFGEFAYNNAEGFHFVNYVEGIYVGYRFYETFFLNDEAGYDEAVVYPFGHGLSYTSFSQSMGEITSDGNGNFSFDVTVSNTGDMAGREVVQVYYTAPYTEGGIEKSHVELLDFGKTSELAPGASETLSFTFNEEDMASYDTYGAGCYVLEQGNYEIKIMSNSHDVIDSKVLEIASTIVYDANNMRSTDLQSSDSKFESFTNGGVTYLSRANGFENYAEATKTPESYDMRAEDMEGLSNTATYEIPVNDTDVMPTTGAKNGVELYQLRGLSYDDPMWESLLDQLTVEEMVPLVATGGYQTIAVSSVGKLATLDADGPAGFSSFFNAAISGTPFSGAVMIAATWNKDLAYQRGTAMGEEALGIGVSGWYAPAMNIHRTAFAGRNFEYYSEDPILSGKMAAGEVKGAQEKGLYVYIKHFALNDQETKRCDMLCTWSNEQAIRQIYLKPFEDAVKEGGATAVMSSFNYIGNEWAGGCDTLLNQVLRGEWGFRGMVLTDYFGDYGYMDADKAIRNGNDIMLSPMGEGQAVVEDSTSATAVNALRTASKNIMYTVVNSNIYEDYTGGLNLMNWQKVAIGIDVALLIVLIALEAVAIMKYRKKETE